MRAVCSSTTIERTKAFKRLSTLPPPPLPPISGFVVARDEAGRGGAPPTGRGFPRRCAEFQWFLIALSGRPGSSFAIFAQRLPMLR
jgi:hypothetical protein